MGLFWKIFYFWLPNFEVNRSSILTSFSVGNSVLEPLYKHWKFGYKMANLWASFGLQHSGWSGNTEAKQSKAGQRQQKEKEEQTAIRGDADQIQELQNRTQAVIQLNTAVEKEGPSIFGKRITLHFCVQKRVFCSFCVAASGNIDKNRAVVRPL
jgi:hypothetical protein